MHVRLTSISDEQFKICHENECWGSRGGKNNAPFKDWQEGDYLAFSVNKELAGLAKIVGDPFISEEPIWENDLFPYRINLKFIYVFEQNNRIPIKNNVLSILHSAWGKNYGWAIVAKRPLPDNQAKKLLSIFESHASK